MEHSYLSRIRRLTLLLLISGAINFLALGFFVYAIIKDPIPSCTDPKIYFRSEPQISLVADLTNADVIQSMKTLTFEQLVQQLHEKALVENGYTQRDLALACLTSYYDFDLLRALEGNQSLQRRILLLGPQPQSERILIYPGLNDEHFETILQFLQSEQWPYTARGLFKRLNQNPLDQESTIADAFCLTPEFMMIETLFYRSEAQVSKKELLDVLREGDWKMMADFAEQQRNTQEYSVGRRHQFLIEYIKKHSKNAAYLLLKTDQDFALRKLDDNTLLMMLELLIDHTREAEKFVVNVICSPRCDAVLKYAAERFYDYLGEQCPEQIDLRHLSQRLIAGKLRAAPTKIRTTQPTSKKAPPLKTTLYVVQEGDSLWKIAKRFKVEIEALKYTNQLKTDVLKPGTSLKIP